MNMPKRSVVFSGEWPATTKLTGNLVQVGLCRRPAALWHELAAFGLDWLLPQAQVPWGRVMRRDAALPSTAA